MLGHKCLRLVGAINGGAMPARRKKSTGVDAVSKGSSVSNSPAGSESGEAGGGGASSAEVDSDEGVVVRHEIPGIVLTVDLSSPQTQVGQSGVQALMHEGSIHDVEGFIASRDDPVCRIQEADKLIDIQ
ncbi:hypothetical protein P8452_22934 [Trifolium repens]|nr:hypothetical protein P8452_22934 [Trifolium repens]